MRGLSPFDLLIGRARIEIARSEDAVSAGPLKGALLVSRNLIGVDNVDATVPLAAVLAPLPIGSVTLTGFGVRFDSGACARASGGVRATLAGSLAGVAVNEGLAGNATLRRAVRAAAAGERVGTRAARLPTR